MGKSLLFRNLTRRYVTVSNFPGTTVEVVRADASFEGRAAEIIDTPGLNDLEQQSEDARVTQRLIEEYPDASILQVADAKNLRRALYLTLQLAELGRPMVLALNMSDELEARGGHIDTERLSELIGIPVVSTVAPDQTGMLELIEALPGRPPSIEVNGSSTAALLERINDIMGETYTIEQPDHASAGVRLGFWAMHPVKGLFFVAALLFAVFLAGRTVRCWNAGRRPGDRGIPATDQPRGDSAHRRRAAVPA